MGAIEIFLVSAGAVLVAVTYLLSSKFESESSGSDIDMGEYVKRAAQELAREEVERELSLAIDEKIENALIKLDKLTNEKIMAVGSYSEEILDKISKNHEEVMFLYNMLNEKEETLKNTVRDIEALKLSIKNMIKENKISDLKKDGETLSKENTREEDTDNNKTIDDNKAEAMEDSDFLLNKNDIILKMHSEGSTDIDIAKKLEIGIGEVRLVIDLFKGKGDETLKINSETK